MAQWNYNRVNEKGRLVSYYGVGQAWKYTDIRGEHEIEVKHFAATEYGVQYFWVTLDGKFQEKRVSAARLSFFLLREKHAKKIRDGTPQLMPLQTEEVRTYYEKNKTVALCNCPLCGGTGFNDRNGKICICTHSLEDEILRYNAQLRLKDILKV